MSIESPDTEFDDPRCQGASSEGNQCQPWAGTPRADDHHALERLLLQTPEGAPIIWFARNLFGDNVHSGDKDWQFTKRHAERYHRVFRPTARIAVLTDSGEYENRETDPDFAWVKPATTPSRRVFNNTVSGTSEHRGKPTRRRDESVAKKNAAGILGRRRTLDAAAEWGELVGAFGAKRVGEDASDCQATRFNSVERARKGPNHVAVGFKRARVLDHARGVIVTATTDPERFESIAAAGESLLDDVDKLRRKVDRPPGVTVVEPTKRGVGHAHIVLFGVEVSDLPSKHELHRYWWETRERGHQVDVEPIRDAGESWVWREQDSATVGDCTPDTYLREGPMSVVTAARLDSKELLEVADSYRDRGDATMTSETAAEVDAEVAAETGVKAGAVRRAAWYFGTGLKTVTRPSKELRDALKIKNTQAYNQRTSDTP